MDKKIIDIRSDTVTQPSPAMREAAYRAEVGDDILDEDPTVVRLEEMAAEMLGKEAAIFLPSGTMGNLVALLTHCQRGEEFIAGHKSHIALLERAGSAVVGGIFARTIPNQADGSLNPLDVERSISPDNIHYAPTRLICLENPHNRYSGRILTPHQMKSITDIAKKYKLSTHLDGARIFNASVALNISLSSLVSDMDSVMFSLVKGLAAPAGALLCGDRALIETAKGNRQLLGGSLTKPGMMAAAGIVALQEYKERIAYDHENAKLLSEGIAKIPQFSINLDSIQTNIITFELMDKTGLTAAEFVDRCSRKGVNLLAAGKYRLRAVTHYGIAREDIFKVLSVFKEIVNG